MSLLLSRRLRLGKPAASMRSSLLLILSSGFSSSVMQTPACSIKSARHCGGELGYLIIRKANEFKPTILQKKVSLFMVTNQTVMVGSSHGWVATLEEDGILRLQDDLNPVASDTDPKSIPLPPLVTLPQCQTQMITNMAMSSPSPEEEDCVVAIKFLGPQLSFCRPGQTNSEWTNIRIENPCFFSSRVMYSKKDDMFRIPGSGGHLIGSWDPRKHDKKPQFQKLRFRKYPELTNARREILHSCCTSEHLVESRPTGETFLVKWYRQAYWRGMAKSKTKDLMVFKLDAEGNAVYTSDIGDLRIFLSKSEPFCVLDYDFEGLPNNIDFLDADELGYFSLDDADVSSVRVSFQPPFFIPPQKKRLVVLE